jgi:predicted AAA+ superfamily ATPase
MKKYQKRSYYLNKITPFIGVDLIKVIIGQRRVGKSYILLQLIDTVKNKDKKANIIYINKEENEYDHIVDNRDLIAFVEKNTTTKYPNYLFVDEVQEIENFEKALRHLFAKKKYDIYCTGSNARLLSSEIATGLSGRYIEVMVHTLSYQEFRQFHNLPNHEDTLLQYIRFGGLPFLINLELTEEIVYGYLKSIYNTIILKDVVARYNIRNVNFLNRLVEYLADNIGSLVSANKISDFLKSQKIKTTPNIILNYLSYLSSSFVTHEVSRSDIKGKKIFEVNQKYYWEDLGLRNSLVGYQSMDIGKMLENLVYLHLSRLGYEIFIGQLDSKEVDFVAKKSGKIIYIQVAYLINNQSVHDREFGNLLAINDNYPKIVVSMDKITGDNFRGIKHIHILDFLMNDQLDSL